MKIVEINVENASINWTDQKSAGKHESEKTEHTAKEQPMTSFYDQFVKVGQMIPNVMEVDQEWENSCTLKTIRISYTKKGTRSAKLIFDKIFRITGNSKKLETPMFQFDNPADGEEQTRECSEGQASDLAVMMDEMEKYAKGERQQGLLPLKPVEPEGGEDVQE